MTVDDGPPPTGRFPASVFGVGDEPDPRFTLANERTFLAWIRTGLALTAGGVALEAFSLNIHPGWRLAASMLLLVAGAAAPVLAWLMWRRTERALRLGQPLPSPLMGLPLTIVGGMTALLVLIGAVFR
ncbi:YidH family protein [Terrabacter sp. GCM10028922]|uniref:YidH family protein n=1 Tax=Terrabacter sp. GCM10028922 TaxID=3273428 RepID=UPI00361E1F31